MTPPRSAPRGVHREITGGGWLASARLRHRRHRDVALPRPRIDAEAAGTCAARRPLAGWLRSGPVDVGHRAAGIRRYMLEGTLEAPPHDGDAGNGAAMRMVPVALARWATTPSARCAIEQGRLTHHHPLSDAACRLVGELVHLALPGRGSRGCAARGRARRAAPAFAFVPYRGLASGYVVDTLQTVLHAFFRRAGSRRASSRGEPGRRRRHDRRDRRARSPAPTTARSMPRALAPAARPRRPGGDRGARRAARGPLAARARAPPRLAEHPPHPQLAAHDEQLALALQDRAREEVAREEDARDRDARLEHDVPELPRALAVVGERAEVVHPEHPLARPEPLDDLVGREVVLAPPQPRVALARVAAPQLRLGERVDEVELSVDRARPGVAAGPVGDVARPRGAVGAPSGARWKVGGIPMRLSTQPFSTAPSTVEESTPQPRRNRR